MTRICLITGKKTISGHNVSHACNRTKKQFKVNLHTHRFIIDGKVIRLRLSTKALRILDKTQAIHKTI